MRKIVSRLLRVAKVEDLGQKNMEATTLNIILHDNNVDATVSSPVFRKLMNSNTRYIVEVWQLNDAKFVVFSGYFNGDWTADNVTFNGVFEDQPSADLYVQENLQSEAESKENLMTPEEESAQTPAQETTEEQKTASKKKDLRKHSN